MDDSGKFVSRSMKRFPATVLVFALLASPIAIADPYVRNDNGDGNYTG